MLKRLTNGEFALAVLVASLFWIAVLVWATSYAPTDPEKEACYQAAKNSGRSAEECKSFWEKTSSDPIAMFTLVLAFSTVGLWGATIGLYGAGERQLTHLKESAERQLGAYIGIEWCRVATNDGGTTFEVEIQIKNAGQTPAYDVSHRITAEIQVLHGTQLDFAMPDRSPGIIPIAPGINFILRTPISIGGPSGISTIGMSQTIFSWGRIDYLDVFDKPQHLEFRFRSGEVIRQHNGTTMQTIGWRMDAEDEGNTAT